MIIYTMLSSIINDGMLPKSSVSLSTSSDTLQTEIEKGHIVNEILVIVDSHSVSIMKGTY